MSEQPKSGSVPQPYTDQNQGRSTFHTGSTVQAGSNFGQGSSQLANGSLPQGSEKARGSSYANEKTLTGNFSSGSGERPNQGGYAPDTDQQEANRQQGEMHNERDLDNLQQDQQGPAIDEDLDRSEPEEVPGTQK